MGCSFYTNGGTGFEVFFVDTAPNTCMLVVATVTKKEFITLSVKEFSLDTNRWVKRLVLSCPDLTCHTPHMPHPPHTPASSTALV